jgi:trigger factor
MSIPNVPPSQPQHSLTQDGPCVRHLEIHVSAEEVEKETDTAARRLGRKTRLPGFRPGKAPVKVIRQRFGAELDEETVEGLASRHVGAILKEHEEEPVASPVLEGHERLDDGSLKLTARFEVHPPFQVADYRGLSLKRPPATLGDDEMDAALESIRQGMARLRPVDDRGATRGDDVLVNLDGEFMEGPEKGERFQRQELPLQIGSDDFHAQMSIALEGARAGETREAVIHYPADYRTEGLAGRVIRYQLHVEAVRQREIPDLDDALARDAGDFENLAALREKVREDLTRDKERRADEAVRNDVIRHLLERNPFEVPPVLVQQEAMRRLEGLARELAARGVDPAQAGVEWEKERDRQAGRAADDIRVARILDAVAEKESLVADDAEMKKLFEAEAKVRKRTAAAVRGEYEKDGRIENLRRHMTRDRVLDFLISLGHIHSEGEQP